LKWKDFAFEMHPSGIRNELTPDDEHVATLQPDLHHVLCLYFFRWQGDPFPLQKVQKRRILADALLRQQKAVMAFATLHLHF
jgi:hypothetical protein